MKHKLHIVLLCTSILFSPLSTHNLKASTHESIDTAIGVLTLLRIIGPDVLEGLKYLANFRFKDPSRIDSEKTLEFIVNPMIMTVSEYRVALAIYESLEDNLASHRKILNAIIRYTAPERFPGEGPKRWMYFKYDADAMDLRLSFSIFDRNEILNILKGLNPLIINDDLRSMLIASYDIGQLRVGQLYDGEDIVLLIGWRTLAERQAYHEKTGVSKSMESDENKQGGCIGIYIQGHDVESGPPRFVNKAEVTLVDPTTGKPVSYDAFDGMIDGAQLQELADEIENGEPNGALGPGATATKQMYLSALIDTASTAVGKQMSISHPTIPTPTPAILYDYEGAGVGDPVDLDEIASRKSEATSIIPPKPVSLQSTFNQTGVIHLDESEFDLSEEDSGDRSDGGTVSAANVRSAASEESDFQHQSLRFADVSIASGARSSASLDEYSLEDW